MAAVIGAATGAAAGYFAWGQITYLAQSRIDFLPLPGVDVTTDRTPAAALPPSSAHSEGPAAVASTDAARSLQIAATLDRERRMVERLAGESADDRALRVWVQSDAAAALGLQVFAAGPDPAAARTAVQAVTAAYRAQTRIHEEAQHHRENAEAAADLLLARERVADTRVAVARSLAQSPETDGPAAARLDQHLTEARDAQNRIDQLSQQLTRLSDTPPPTLAQLAAVDRQAEDWTRQRQQVADQIGSLAWPWRPALANRLLQYAILTQQLQRRAGTARLVVDPSQAAPLALVRFDQLRSEIADLQTRRDRHRHDAEQLKPYVEAQRQAAADLAAAEAEAARLAAALARLEPGGVLQINDPELPDQQTGRPAVTVGPWHDTRIERAVVGGLLGAGFLPWLLTLGFLTDAKVRRDPGGGLVGSDLPHLSSVPVVRDAADAAAPETADAPGSLIQSLQSIRAVIESRLAAGDFSIALTGVGPGSGTTSSAVGLATAIAQTGSRLLLVDLAWLQKPAGRGDDEQATRQGLGIDGVIEALGYLEDEDREALMLAEGEAEAGFAALLAGKSLRRSVIQTRVAGLDVLSTMGRARTLRDQWAGRVSSRWLSKLLDVARRGGYDALLIDAGSAAGSVEGMLGCAAADAVVVVVSNDQTQSEFQKAVSRLQIVGARVIGTVLNRSGSRRRLADPSTKSGRGAFQPARTTGSGIFAAALESRHRDAPSASGHAPLPHDDPAGPQHRPEHPLAEADEEPRDAAATSPAPPAAAAVDPLRSKTFPRVDPDTPPIPAGVDPFDEPPAEAGPTPLRLAPRRRPSADARAEASADTPRSKTEPDPSDDSGPLLDDLALGDSPHQVRPALEVHVADDVMDQLVNHAIRTARRPERPPTTLQDQDAGELQPAETPGQSSPDR